MVAIGTFLVVAVISLILTRLATGALIATGLPASVARFQARSAFTTVGFTTAEAESIVVNPSRRKIISWSMLIGNLGTPTLIVTVILGFVAPGPGDTENRLIVLFVGAGALLVLLWNPWAERWLVRLGQRVAAGRFASRVRDDFEELVAISDGYVVGELKIRRKAFEGEATVLGFQHAARGLRILAIRRTTSEGDKYIGDVTVDMHIQPGDVLVAYGPRVRFRELSETSDDDDPGLRE